MNEFLADLYGTRQQVGASEPSNIDKLAEAQILDDLFKAEGVDVDQLPNETLLKVATELFGADSALVKSAGDMPPQFEEGKKHEKGESKKEKKEEGEEEETEEEKLANADYIGRVMAHAFWNEKGELEKAASAKAGAAPSLQNIVKKASQQGQKPTALDVLAEQRAVEMLKEAGYTEQAPATQGKTDEQKLKEAVDARALEMLKASGYPVQ